MKADLQGRCLHMSCWSAEARCSLSSEVARGHLAWPFPAGQPDRAGANSGHQSSCRSDTRTLQPSSYLRFFASSSCQLYSKSSHAVGLFVFTQLSKDSVKRITCSTCIYHTKINKTQPQDLLLIFKARAHWWRRSWWKCSPDDPSQGLGAPNPTEGQGSYLAAKAAWTSHQTSWLGREIPAAKATLRK